MASYTLSQSEETEFLTIPDDTVLEAEVVSVEERESMNLWVDKDDHTKGKQNEVNFKFRVTEEGPYQGYTLFGNTPVWFNTSSRCKLRNWAQEIFGADELPEGFELNTEHLVGEPVKVIVGTYWSKKNERDQNQVKDLSRLAGDVAWADNSF